MALFNTNTIIYQASIYIICLFKPANLAFCVSCTAYKFMKAFDHLSASYGHTVMKKMFYSLWKSVMCPNHFCRVRVTSPSSRSHLKLCRVESDSSHD